MEFQMQNTSSDKNWWSKRIFKEKKKKRNKKGKQVWKYVEGEIVSQVRDL